MENIDTDFLFPMRVIPYLVDLRGGEWRKLVSIVESTVEDSMERLAFVLLMVRLGGCATCNSNSFRAMRGCTDCAQRTIRRYRDDDEDLIKEYSDCLDEIKNNY